MSTADANADKSPSQDKSELSEKADEAKKGKLNPLNPCISVMTETMKSEMTDILLSVDPEEAKFALAGGGKVDHMLVNYSKKKMAIKAKCNNNNSYRVDPVFQFIEGNKCKSVKITRILGAGAVLKNERVIIEYSEVDDSETDAKQYFKKNSGMKFPFLKISIAVSKTINSPKSGEAL